MRRPLQSASPQRGVGTCATCPAPFSCSLHHLCFSSHFPSRPSSSSLPVLVSSLSCLPPGSPTVPNFHSSCWPRRSEGFAGPSSFASPSSSRSGSRSQAARSPGTEAAGPLGPNLALERTAAQSAAAAQLKRSTSRPPVWRRSICTSRLRCSPCSSPCPRRGAARGAPLGEGAGAVAPRRRLRRGGDGGGLRHPGPGVPARRVHPRGRARRGHRGGSRRDAGRRRSGRATPGAPRPAVRSSPRPRALRLALPLGGCAPGTRPPRAVVPSTKVSCQPRRSPLFSPIRFTAPAASCTRWRDTARPPQAGHAPALVVERQGGLRSAISITIPTLSIQTTSTLTL